MFPRVLASAALTVVALAAELGLGMSGSSDYHGEGKPNRLGENLMPPDLLARIVDEGALPVVSA